MVLMLTSAKGEDNHSSVVDSDDASGVCEYVVGNV